MPIVTVGPVQLYYEVRGSGPPVLFIMGATGDAGHFATVAEQLADEGPGSASRLTVRGVDFLRPAHPAAAGDVRRSAAAGGSRAPTPARWPV